MWPGMTTQPIRDVGASSSNPGAGTSTPAFDTFGVGDQYGGVSSTDPLHNPNFRPRYLDELNVRDVDDGRPKFVEPLRHYKTHRCRSLWINEAVEMIVKSLRRGDRWQTVRSWPREANQWNWWYLARHSELHNLDDIRMNTVDHCLIQAFLYRWHPETNSFNHQWGEMTITLYDVHKLFGLQIDGRPLVPTLSNFVRQQWLTENFNFGTHDFVRSGNSFFHNSLDLHMANLVLNPQTPHRVIATGYLLEVLGCLVLNDRTTTSLSIAALDFVTDHTRIPEYAWGTSVLAYLYRQLGISSRSGMSTIGGCTALLQYWIFAHFPMFSPGVSEDPAEHGDPRWESDTLLDPHQI